MTRIIVNILLTILIIWLGWWARIVWIPAMLLAIVWAGWYYRQLFRQWWANFRFRYKKRAAVTSAAVIMGCGLLAGILLYRFIFELISVPSPSMEKAIDAGDYIVVNKLVPGPRRHPEDAGRYFRMRGLDSLKRGDIILFNFPEGDTILENRPDESYYYLKRHYNNFDRLRKIRQWGNLVPLDVKERPRFVKRLAALPGDTVEIINSNIYINKQKNNLSGTTIKKYRWLDSKTSFSKMADQENILNHYEQKGHIVAEMSTNTYNSLPEEIKIKFKPTLLEKNIPDRHTFPFDRAKNWNTDFMGPVVIPAKGEAIPVDMENIEIYQRAIRVYEQNDLEIKDGDIYINDEPADQYRFKFNYYWVMGDNRPQSFDSRFWGFLPENHIIGKIPEKFINLEDE